MAARQLLLLAAAVCLLSTATALVQLPPLIPSGPGFASPVTKWLLSSSIPDTDVRAWRKIGAKIWTFMSNLDNDFVDAVTGVTVPPRLPGATRIFGPKVTCGRFTRIFDRLAFHDCGTFDVGGTGSVGDTGKPRFGCNGSLRFELPPCTSGAPACVDGYEAAIDLATGAFLPETPFTSLIAKYGAANIQFGQDAAFPRGESTGFTNAIAFLYQIKMETEVDEPAATHLDHVSLADLIVYAGFLSVAKCGGPQVEFSPGRTDSLEFDAPFRLPDPAEFLSFNVAYFWTNGMTSFDMVNLLSAHTTGCFSFGCMDNTPSLFDQGWTRIILDIHSAADPRICELPGPVGPPPPAVQQCVLPSDVEFNTRADIRAYLQAQVDLVPIATAAAVNNPCFYQPGVPVIPGQTCDVGPGSIPFVPFRLLSTAEGSVNLCSRRYDNFFFQTAGCKRVNPKKTYDDLFASSYFKLTKLYVDAVTGEVAGKPYGVARQPCTPGMEQIGNLPVAGADPAIPVPDLPNPLCACCPNPLPQDFHAVPVPPQFLPVAAPAPAGH